MIISTLVCIVLGYAVQRYIVTPGQVMEIIPIVSDKKNCAYQVIVGAFRGLVTIGDSALKVVQGRQSILSLPFDETIALRPIPHTYSFEMNDNVHCTLLLSREASSSPELCQQFKMGDIITIVDIAHTLPPFQIYGLFPDREESFPYGTGISGVVLFRYGSSSALVAGAMKSTFSTFIEHVVASTSDTLALYSSPLIVRGCPVASAVNLHGWQTKGDALWHPRL